MKVEPGIQDRPSETGRRGKWWVAALVSLVGCTGLGALFGITKHDGLAAFILTVYGLIIGASLCVIFAIISFAKNEMHRIWAIIPALLCVGLLVWGLSAVAQKRYGDSEFVQSRGSFSIIDWLKWKYHQWDEAQRFKVYRACLEQLKADPEIALREHWPATRTTVQSEALFDAIWAPYVEFSASQVERIYAAMPPFREVVFKQAACTPQFLSAHFQEAFDLAQKGSDHMLMNIVHHPNTPIKLVQRVVFYQKQLPFEPPYQAGLILQIRESDVPTDLRGILRPYERKAEGKFFVLTLDGSDFQTLNGDRSRQFPREVNSYVPGVPPDFDLSQLGQDELVFLPGLYNENSDMEKEQVRLAEAFALEHNQRVLQQRAAK